MSHAQSADRATPRASPSDNRPHPAGSSCLPDLILHGDVRRRRGNRSIKRTPPLETFHERRCLLLADSAQYEMDADAGEQRNVFAGLAAPVDGSPDRDGYARQGDLLVTADHVDDLDAASRDGGQEDLRRRGRFTRAAVLDRPIDDEVVIERAAEHTPERRGRVRLDLV